MSRPRILLNFAITADGKIGSSSGKPSRFTTEHDHQRLHAIREQADAILVARGTLEADRMTMTTPARTASPPWRCVISRQGVFDESHPLFHTQGGPIHLFITEQQTKLPDQIQSQIAGVHHMEIPSMLHFLSEQGIETLLCEGGGELVRELMAMKLVDVFYLTLAGHVFLGGSDAITPTGRAGTFLPASCHYELIDQQKVSGGEIFLTYTRKA